MFRSTLTIRGLKSGFTGREAQTIIPLAALSQENGKTVVQVKAGENWEARQVVTGLRNGTHVAVTNGIKPGEIVKIN